MTQLPDPDRTTSTRHAQMFELLRQSHRAAQTTARLALPERKVLNAATAETIRQRACASLRQTPSTPPVCRSWAGASPGSWHRMLRLMVQRDHKNMRAARAAMAKMGVTSES